jgi:hypothetical protein
MQLSSIYKNPILDRNLYYIQNISFIDLKQINKTKKEYL